MLFQPDIKEEELKNRIAQRYFHRFDCASILKRIDFTVQEKGAQPPGDKYILWAEAKQHPTDIYRMLTQLLITIIQDAHHLIPPKFIGCFDNEKISLIEYGNLLPIFALNDFNWTQTPSQVDNKTIETVRKLIDPHKLYTFVYGQDDKELKNFIANNFGNSASLLSTLIDRNNFIFIYQKWRNAVMPYINADWDALKNTYAIYDRDFFLAELNIDDKGTTDIFDDSTVYDNFYITFHPNDKMPYELLRKEKMGMNISYKFGFKGNGKDRYAEFWKLYKRPPVNEIWKLIIERIDLLVPQDVRERKGAFFTPQIWVEKSQHYLAETLGANWQEEYYIWDCCAGTGNLLNGLTNKYHVFASTLDQQDVDVMHERIRNGANLLDSHVFQFDFLNDELLPISGDVGISPATTGNESVSLSKTQSVLHTAEPSRSGTVQTPFVAGETPANPTNSASETSAKTTTGDESVSLSKTTHFPPFEGVGGVSGDAGGSPAKNRTIGDASKGNGSMPPSAVKTGKIPNELYDILTDPNKRKKLIIYINPPYAEATSATTVTGTGANKAKVATDNATYRKYKSIIGKASNELFAQFFIRIYKEIPGCVLAEFSTLKILQASNFAVFRAVFKSRLLNAFAVPANTFDNVKGQFPIGFFIWDTQPSGVRTARPHKKELTWDAGMLVGRHGDPPATTVPPFVQNDKVPTFEGVGGVFGSVGISPTTTGDESVSLSKTQSVLHTAEPSRSGTIQTPFVAGETPANQSTSASETSANPTTHIGRYLPHKDYKRYQFITFRLYDSVPKEVLLTWKKELDACNTEDEQDRMRIIQIHKRVDEFEDMGYGACYLQDARIAKIVQDAFLYFHNIKYHLINWCIMPNHVHVLIEMLDGTISSVLHSWRTYTAHAANKILGRSGSFWMEEYFDRFIRNSDHFRDVMRYINANPIKAGLCEDIGQWKWCGYRWNGEIKLHVQTPFVAGETPAYPTNSASETSANPTTGDESVSLSKTQSVLQDLSQNFYSIDFYNNKGEFLSSKKVFVSDSDAKSINQWIKEFDTADEGIIGFMENPAPDYQNNKFLCITNNQGSRHNNYFKYNKNTLIVGCIYFAVRQCIPATWINDRDQFLYPNDGWKDDATFQTNCLVYTLFHGQNRITINHKDLKNLNDLKPLKNPFINHWIPFSEEEVGAKTLFQSHFMHDFLTGRLPHDNLMSTLTPTTRLLSNPPLLFSYQAQAVLDAGRELWRYYHSMEDAKTNASLYDIKSYFQGHNDKGKMNPNSQDPIYTKLLDDLKRELRSLGDAIEPKVYEYDFLKQ